MMFGNYSLTSMIGSIMAVLLAITCHELAHGYIAYRLGDPTAKSQGRLTMNPLAHLDPMGTLLLLIAGFGWAKPVPVNPYYFKGDRNKGMIKVSIAGPAANLMIAFFAVFIYYQLNAVVTSNAIFQAFIMSSIYLNVFLALFNLIPIPPLDGSKILAGFLPQATAYKYLSTVEQYGFLILMVLILLNITDIIISPIAGVIIQFFSMIAAIF